MQLKYAINAKVFVPKYCQCSMANISAVFINTRHGISASAAGVRGLMIHLKETGYLLEWAEMPRKVLSESQARTMLDQRLRDGISHKWDS
jgi:hypothetical protein